MTEGKHESLRGELKVGVVGCGAIGSELCKALLKGIPGMKLVGVNDIVSQKATNLAKSLGRGIRVLPLDGLILSCDLVIESASKKAAPLVARESLSKGKSVMIMSVGGLIGKMKELQFAFTGNARLYVPTGAICGIDAVKAASCGNIYSVNLTTRKHPSGFTGAPFVLKKGIRLEQIKKKAVTLFEGTVDKAVSGFPQNINVAATLALAGMGVKKTRVKIIADPGLHTNNHTIEVTGSFGKFTTTACNIPHPTNKKTSFLAVLSGIATLKQIASRIRIGT